MYRLLSLCSLLLSISVFGTTIETEKYSQYATCIIERNDDEWPVRKEIIDEDGVTLALEEVSYVDQGIFIKDCAYHQGNMRYISESYYQINQNDQIIKRVLGLNSDKPQTTIYHYHEDGKIASVVNPKGIIITYEYDNKMRLSKVSASDNTVCYEIRYEDNGVVHFMDHLNGNSIVRQLDANGNIVREIFPNGHQIGVSYSANNLVTKINLFAYGEVYYEYESGKLGKVKRVSSGGNVIYEHTYDDFDETGFPIKEHIIHGLGVVKNLPDAFTKTLKIETPFIHQYYQFDGDGVLCYKKLNETKYHFSHDKMMQLIIDTEYDSLGNPVNAEVNERNELLSYNDMQFIYDDNGNLIRKITPEKVVEFSYDAFDRLIKISQESMDIIFTYDFFGRRLYKTIYQNGQKVQQTSSIYLKENELALFDEQNKLKELRIFGYCLHESLVKSVAIETSKDIYAPIYDQAFNILQLVDIATKEVVSYEGLTPFGDNLYQIIGTDPITTWIYACKHYDIETNLIYFGSRYYDPEIKRWLTLDPAGRVQVANLYNYVMNNPLILVDVDGKGFSAALPLLKWGTKKVVIGLIPGFGQIASLIGIGMTLYEGAKLGYQLYNKWKDQNNEPPYNGKELGNDPSKCPGEGFEWRGKGSPESGNGNWIKGEGELREKLYPDLNHPDPIGPHWDYHGPGFQEGIRLYPDGSWETKT